MAAAEFEAGRRCAECLSSIWSACLVECSLALVRQTGRGWLPHLVAEARACTKTVGACRAEAFMGSLRLCKRQGGFRDGA